MSGEHFISSSSNKFDNITGIGNQTEVNTTDIEEEDQPPVLVKGDGMNSLGLVVFAMLFGRTISVMGAKGEPLKCFFESLSEAVIRLLLTLYWYCPIGIIFIIAGKIVQLDDPLTNMVQMGLFVTTVLCGLVIHGFIFLPAIYFVIVRKNPFRFLYNQIEAIVTVFALSSSMGALPITMRCLIEKNNIDRRVVNFIVPLGTTINMDGTALFEAVACIFIAQLRNIPLNIGQVITVSVTATLAAIGTSAIPSGGMITLLMVIASVGLPSDDIGVIFTIDWFLSRCRGTTNIIGDAFGAGIVDHLSRKELNMADNNGDINHVVLEETNSKNSSNV